MAASVGIDLGTTYSAVAVVDASTGLPRILPNREGAHITPSVIQFLDGEPVFGSEAESAFRAGEPDCAASFKRSMGSGETYCTVDGRAYTAEDLSALLLRRLREDAEAALGGPVGDAVITVPAYFYSTERESTIRAAERAGLKVRQIIDEPNAAAMAYGLNHWRENANILVYDLGGGTFDVTLIRMGKDGNLNTLVTRGNHMLGGRDWDSRMEELLLEKFEADTGEDLREEGLPVVRGLAEEVKRKLTAMPSARVGASFPGCGQASASVTRKEFDDATSDLLDRTGALCQAVLTEAGLSRSDVTDVLLVGGSTRMPQVSEYLTKMFGKKPITHVNPDEAVALGAAIQATKSGNAYAKLSVIEKGGRKQTDRRPLLRRIGAVKKERRLGVGTLTVQETTAHAMGVVAIHDEERRYYNEIIIPANHPRPVRAAKRFRFFTSPDGPNELEIYVLQGDSPNPADCQIPFKYVVTGIQHVEGGGEYGTVIRVQYSYDQNGVIHVQARQGRAETDLPIRREPAPADLSRFSRPPEQADRSMGVALRGTDQNLVHKYKAITFSNVAWKKYDHVAHHPNAAMYHEPSVHIKASEKKIEFHGYNISQMDEGVTYTISAEDDFDISCHIDTSTIKPHPGGHVIISLGIISANLDEHGGAFFLDGEHVADVGPKFHLRMSLTEGGLYEIGVNGMRVGRKEKPSAGTLDVVFGFVHESHHCELLSHAYISNIQMRQAVHGGNDSAETPTWDD